MKKLIAIIFSVLFGWLMGYIIYCFSLPIEPKETKEDKKYYTIK